MKMSRYVTVAAALLCTAGASMAQTGTTTNMYVFKRLDLSSAYGGSSAFTAGNPVFIGNNPSAGSLLRGSMYLAGFNNGTAGEGVLKISNVFSTPLIPSTAFNRFVTGLNFPGSRGIYGLDTYRRALPGGGFESRLLFTGDLRSNTDPRKIMIFDIEAASPTEVARIDPGASGLLLASSLFGSGAWDFGFNGQGFANATQGVAAPAPVPAILDFGMRGPVGLQLFANPAAPPALIVDPSFGTAVYGAFPYGDPNPGYVGPRLVPDGAGNTQFRDIDIDPRDGTLLATSNNSIIVARRDATAADPNNTTIPKYGRYSVGSPDPYTGSTTTPIRIYGSGWTLGSPSGPANIAGWNVALASDYQDATTGDLIFWNDRASTASTPFVNIVRANRYNDATPVTVSYLNPDGTPAALGSGTGYYDFSWDAEAKVLAVTDFSNRSVYFMSNAAPVACTLPSGAGCVLLPANLCTADYVGGTAGAAGSTCPVGICCTAATGACVVSTQEACLANGNTSVNWLGTGTCAPTNSCPQPGSCCNPSTGACTIGLSTQCASTSLFTAGVTVCPPAPSCPASGTCCVGSACTVTFQSQCTGVWTSGGSCTPSPCSAPSSFVCCRGATCTTVTATANCTAGPGVGVRTLDPAVTSCAGQSTLLLGCCFADFDKSGSRTIDDIFIYLNAWFANSPFTKVGGDGVQGRTIDDIFLFLNAWFAGCN